MQIFPTSTDEIRELLTQIATSLDVPDRPDPALDPYLDAAMECVERFGWARTSPRDIARLAGVERTTIYRHLGPKENILRLLVARESHDLIARSIEIAATGEPGPELVVEVVAAGIEAGRSNPIVVRLLRDESGLLGRVVEDGHAEAIDLLTRALAPALQLGMDLGYVRSLDAKVVTEWMIHTALSVLLTPPAGDLRDWLRVVILPLLTPEPSDP